MKNKVVLTVALCSALLLLAGITRVLLVGDGNSFASYSPVGAMFLVAGAYLRTNWKAFVIPFIVLIVSDLVINSYIYQGTYGLMYDGWLINYAVMAAIVFIGSRLLAKPSVTSVFAGALASAALFWLVMDFVAWTSPMSINVVTNLPLSRDLSGLLQSYAQGLPFAKNFFIGTFLYGSLMTGVYALVNRYAAKTASPELA